MAEVMISFIEEILAYILLKNVTLPSKSKRAFQIAGVFIITAAVSILTFLNINSSMRMMAALVMQMTYAYTCFEASGFEKMIWGSSYTMIAVFADNLTFKIAEVINHFEAGLLTEPGIVRYQMAVIYLLSSAVIVFLIIKFKKNRLYLPRKYQLLLLAITASGLVVSDKLLDLSISVSIIMKDSNVEILVNVIYILLFAIIIFTWYTVTSLAGVYYEREQLKNDELLRNHETKELDHMRNMIYTLRAWKHDFRNHIQLIRGLIEGGSIEEANDLLAQIYGDLEQSTTFLSSGDTVMDVIISSKIMAARDRGIRFDCKIHLEEELRLDELQKSSLLSNLLDNAIEANANVAEEERYIELVIKSFADNQLITVRNSYDGRFIMKDGEFTSTKKEKGHGQGIKIIKKIIREVNGTCEITPGENSFAIEIIL